MFPPHTGYLEPYLGSAAVLLAKDRVPVEIVNDIDGAVTNFYKVLRDDRSELERVIRLTPYARLELKNSLDDPDLDPIERARRFFVRTNQRFGGNSTGTWTKTLKSHARPSNGTKWITFTDRLESVATRLFGVQIDSIDALKLITSVIDNDDPHMAIYADPPYLSSTRNGSAYDADIDTDHHVQLLTLLSAHPGPVIISGYPSPLYDDLTAHHDWTRTDLTVKASGQAGLGSAIIRTEVLWTRNCLPV